MNVFYTLLFLLLLGFFFILQLAWVSHKTRSLARILLKYAIHSFHFQAVLKGTYLSTCYISTMTQSFKSSLPTYLSLIHIQMCIRDRCQMETTLKKHVHNPSLFAQLCTPWCTENWWQGIFSTLLKYVRMHFIKHLLNDKMFNKDW